MDKVRVGILGATGMVGQMYQQLLKDHPWFELTYLGSSKTKESPLGACELLFSCAGNTVAALEEELAEQGLVVISHSSAHRRNEGVPLIIPEINGETLRPEDRLIAKPNCSLQSYLLPLFPLHREFGVKRALVTSLQARSGAGRDFELEENILPYIAGEEEKSCWEPRQVLKHPFPIGATCVRVPVEHGHMAVVSVEFEKKPSLDQIRDAWDEFEGLDLPTAPKKPVIYQEEADRPQPLLDRDAENGMAVTVGRLRECPILDATFVGLSHNVVRGAAGGGLLTAELLYETKSLLRAAPGELCLS